jgi:hypothetical protein
MALVILIAHPEDVSSKGYCHSLPDTLQLTGGWVGVNHGWGNK